MPHAEGLNLVLHPPHFAQTMHLLVLYESYNNPQAISLYTIKWLVSLWKEARRTVKPTNWIVIYSVVHEKVGAHRSASLPVEAISSEIFKTVTNILQQWQNYSSNVT